MKKRIDFDFYKMILAIAIPAMVQQFVTALGTLVDNLMIGSLGAFSIGGVGAANSIFTSIMFLSFGISQGANIYISQLYGAKKLTRLHKAFIFGMINSLILGILAFIGVGFFKEELLSLFSKDQGVIKEGISYLSVVVFAYIIIVLNIFMGGSFRAIGKTKFPMIAGIIAIVTNTSLNYFLINGNFGFPALGVKGAALATVISKSLEFILLIVFINIYHMPFKPKLEDLKDLPMDLYKKIVKKTIPISLNEFLFGFGMALSIALYGQGSVENLTSIQMNWTIGGLFFIVMDGFAVATSVAIGQSLGRNEIEKAKGDHRKIILLGIFIGVIMLILSNISSLIIPNLYNVSPEIKTTTASLIRVMGLFFPLFITSANQYFTLSAGGDIKGVVLMDGFVVWGLAIPILAVLTFFTDFSITTKYFITNLTELAKIGIGIYCIRKGNWAKNLTN